MPSNDPEDIRQQMAEIRQDLRENMQGMVENASALTDWKRYVRLYPWASVALAAGVGYMLVPRRSRRSMPHLTSNELAKIDALTKALDKQKKGGLSDQLFRLLLRSAVGGAQAYAIQYVNRLMGRGGDPGAAAGMESAEHRGTGQPRGPYPAC